MPHRSLATLCVVLAGVSSVRSHTLAAVRMVTSSTVVAGQPIPRQHTADGENTSPALAWTVAPPITESFAVVCDAPDVLTPQLPEAMDGQVVARGELVATYEREAAPPVRG